MLSRSFLRHLFACALVFVGSVVACSPGEPVDQGDPYPDSTGTCVSDAECGGGTPLCDPLRGCVACQLDAQCDEGERCVDRVCEPLVTCSVAADCDGTSTPTCEFATGICEQCVVDANCGGGQRCVDKRCETATSCTNSRDCGDDRVCDRAVGWCVTCLGDADCDEESTCVDNSCVARCSSDKNCAADNLLCNVDGGYCVECIADVDCPDSYHCAAGTCEIDVCQSGEGRCDPLQNAALNCNAQGSDFVPVLCPTGTSCSEGDGTATCTPWVCEPLSASCSDDGSTLRVCAEDGLGYSEEVDCAAQDGTCEGTACVDVVCEAGTSECSGAMVVQCNLNGTSLSVTDTCGLSEHCDEEFAACRVDVCVQGTPTCDGDVATTCNADGSGFEEDGTDCSESGEICFQGQCLPKLCEDGVRHCYEGAVYNCMDGGTRRSIYNDCHSALYCDDTGGTATCRTKVCTPGGGYCDGEVAGVCNAEGSGAVEGSTTNCAALDGKACFSGDCLDVVCPDTYGCHNGHPYYCSANGTGYGSQRDVCQSTEHCVEGVSSCRTDVCTQGSPACDGNVATTCNADGSGYEPGGTDCGEEQKCVGGTCLPLICTPYASYCEEGNVYRCGSDGTTSSLYDTCLAGEHCVDGYSSCRQDVCTAGEPHCNGELVSTCNAEGSGAEEGGTACQDGETCDGGACAEIVCAPSETFCFENNVERCNALGTAWSRNWTCSAATFCDDSSGTPTCASDVCEAGQPACDGETLALCDEFGGGHVDQTTDCSATGQVCNLNACVEQEVVTLGAGTNEYSRTGSYTYLHMYHVTSSRSLTSIEQMFSVSGTSQFVWYVYEHSAATGTFTKIFEKLTTGSGAATYHGSGAIDVPLTAGNYYLIAVRVVGAHSYFTATGSPPEWLSFGSFRTSRTLSTTPAATYNLTSTIQSSQFTQRLTTEAP